MKIKVICFLLSIFISSFTLYAEEINKEYLMSLLKSSKTKEAMTYLKEKLHSDDEKTRKGVYNVMGMRIYPKYPEYRKEIVEILSSRLNDGYSSRVINEYLYKASPEYYTETAKQNLLTAFEKKENLSNTIHLLGHANVTEAIPLLKSAIDKYDHDIKAYQESVRKSKEENSDPRVRRAQFRGLLKGKNSAKQALPYHEALARMGDREEIDHCLNYFDQEVKKRALFRKKNEPKYILKELLERGHISNVKHYAYIRQPETIDLLHKALLTKATYNRDYLNIPLSQDGFDALIKCLMIEDVLTADRFGRYVSTKDNIELLQEWMKEHYTPEKIKSLSVLIDGQIVNNFVSFGTATHEKQHIAPPTKEVKPEVAKIEKKQVKLISKVAYPKPIVPSVKPEQSSNMKYIYLAMLCIGAILVFFVTVLVKRRKN